MILATSCETGLPCHIWVGDIQRVETRGGEHPFSRIYLKDTKQRHEFTLDVLEDCAEISRRIKHERLIPASEIKQRGESTDELPG